MKPNISNLQITFKKSGVNNLAELSPRNYYGIALNNCCWCKIFSGILQ